MIETNVLSQKQVNIKSSDICVKGNLIRRDDTVLHHLPLELYAVSNIFFNLFQSENLLSKSETTDKGEFSFVFPKSKISNSNVKYLILRVNSATRGLFSKCKKFTFDSIILDLPHKNEKIADYKTVVAKVLDYDLHSANRFQPANCNHIPQLENEKFFTHVVKAAWDDVLKLLAFSTIEKNATTEIVQITYGLPDHIPKHDSKTVMTMLLEFYDPRAFRKVKDSEDLLLSINLDGYSKDKNGPDVPNVNVYIEKIKFKEKIIRLDIKKIDLDFMRNGKSCIESYKNDDKHFEKALGALTNILFFLAESGAHLSVGHLMPAQYTIAALRNFIKSPIADLLAPFMEGIERINKLGETAIFSKSEGVLGIAGLDEEGIKQILQDNVASLNYNWKPCKPRFEDDHFSKLKNLLYDTFSEGVENFLKKFKEDIEKYKIEIFRFSQDLERYSFDFRDLHGETDPSVWDDLSEVSLGKSRSKAFEPIMKDANTLDDEALGRLKKALTHFIFLIAYHDIIHKDQKRWALYIPFATLAPRNQDLKNDEKKDLYMGTLAKDAAKQLTIGKTLVDLTEYVDKKSFLTHPDISSCIKEPIEKKLKEFEALEVDPKKIISTVMY